VSETFRYIAVIEEESCLGYGDCAALAPEVFELDDVARVRGDAPPEQLVEVAEACPAEAISVIDPSTGERLWPR
jgi:ferredoxin